MSIVFMIFLPVTGFLTQMSNFYYEKLANQARKGADELSFREKRSEQFCTEFRKEISNIVRWMLFDMAAYGQERVACYDSEKVYISVPG